MGMRASDARWLEREIRPFLESIGAAASMSLHGSSQGWLTATGQQAHDLLRQLADRTDGTPPVDSVLHYMGSGRRNPSVRVYEADYNGHRVPYIEITEWPCEYDDGVPTQVYPPLELICENGSYEYVSTYHGDWRWTVSVDDRFAFDFETRDEVEAAIPLLATGMAIAAGFTSHGPHSFPRNPHGPAVGLAWTELEPATAEIVSTGWGPEAIADAVYRLIEERGVKPSQVVEAEKSWIEDAKYWKTRADLAEGAIGRAIHLLEPPDAKVVDVLSMLRFARNAVTDESSGPDPRAVRSEPEEQQRG